MNGGWEETSNGYRLEREGYFISYVPHPSIGYEGPETALVFGEGNERKYLILIGDFRDGFAACKSLEECKQFFKENIQHKGGWSNDL